MAGVLLDHVCTTVGTRPVSLERRALICVNFRNIQGGAIHLQIVLCIRNRGIQELFNNRSSGLGRKLKNCKSLIHLLAADQIDDDLDLAGSNADVLDSCMRTLVGIRFARSCLLFYTSCQIFSLLPLLAG